MNELFELLKYTIPAFIVLIATYLVLNKMVNNEKHKRKTEIILNNQKFITPIRIQAYERMILFLERISPQSLVLRMQNPKMTNQELQNAILKAIRSEYEHNMAHQLYISNQAWEYVKQAKENLTKMVNQTALQVKPDGASIQFSKLILERLLDKDKEPTRRAIAYLKSEIKELYQ